MIGYHDCPPHPLEELHPEFDTKWALLCIQEAKKNAQILEDVFRQYRLLDQVGLPKPQRFCPGCFFGSPELCSKTPHCAPGEG